MDHVFRLACASFLLLLCFVFPAHAVRPQDDTSYTQPSNTVLPLAPSDRQAIIDTLLARCHGFVNSQTNNLQCHLVTNDIGQYPSVAARANDNTLVRVYNAVTCALGFQPDFWEVTCQSACPNHLALSGDALKSASRYLRVRAVVTGIDANKRITYAPQSAALGISCLSGCEWVGGRLDFGPLRTYVENVSTTTVGSPVDVASPHTATGASCDVGENGAQAAGIETFPSEASPAGPGSSLSGSGGLSPSDSNALQSVKDNTGTDGILAGTLSGIRQKLTATPGGQGASGDCTKPVTCEGDAARCEMYFSAWLKRCESSMGDRGDGGGLAQVGADLVARGTLSVRDAFKQDGDIPNIASHMVRQRFLSTAGCPEPLPVNFFGHEISFSFEPLCSLAPIMSIFLIAGASYIGLRIFLPAL